MSMTPGSASAGGSISKNQPLRLLPNVAVERSYWVATSRSRKLRGATRERAEHVVRRTGATLRDMPLPEGKVSDIVKAFSEPLVDAIVESDEGHVDVLKFACILWNLAILRSDSRHGKS